ncbi:MAG: c-type cytochrome [Granulosicoccus sp.]
MSIPDTSQRQMVGLLTAIFCVWLLPPFGVHVLASDTSVHGLSINLGQPVTDEQLANLPSHVFADGEGLPAGEGTAKQGVLLYTDLCAHCHGSEGQGGRAMELVGDRSLLATEYPDKGIAVFWPNAPTLFEYIYRSMPPEAPASLQANELYSLIAYLLSINGLIGNDKNMAVDAELLRSITMPNRSGFVTEGH